MVWLIRATNRHQGGQQQTINWLQVFRRADAALLGSERRPPPQTSAVCEKNAWDSAPAQDTDMRVIAMFAGPCAAAALTARDSVFSHDFKGLV
jgi:hypothetical protein